MGETPKPSKALKKLAKAELKREKKAAKQAVAGPPDADRSRVVEGAGDDSGADPRIRSAEAAERQVKLQQIRVAIALATMLVGLVTLLITWRPWEHLGENQASTPTTQQRPASE
ncbi:MAG: hypothetical protein ACE5E1_09405 [Phycisphaerae bacterium]